MFPLIHRVDEARDDLVFIGSRYGGWWVPSSLLESNSICYLGGVGTDISFDLGLIQEFGCPVWAIDPTPKTVEWISSQDLPHNFAFIPKGLSDQKGELKFYSPVDPTHISHSVKNLQKTDSYFVAEVQSIQDFMEDLGHDHLDLVKLDIEGAEHDTIRQMLADGILPRVICLEYDQPEPISWSLKTTSALRNAGYRIAKVDHFNVTFVLAPT